MFVLIINFQRMKKLILLFTILLSTAYAYAQYYYVPHLYAPGNPGGLNNDDEFPFGGGLSSTWVSIQSGSATNPVWTAQQTIPFPFQFNGNSVSQYYVSTSGVLTFSSTVGAAPSYTNTLLPDAQIPDNSVMIWGVEGTGSNDVIVVKTFGTAPNRQQWIMFSSYTTFGGTGYQYWSIVLEESSNKIYVVDQRNTYADVRVTVGIQLNSSTAINVNNTNILSAVSGSSSNASDNYYYEFLNGVQPQYDLAVISNNLYPTFGLTSAPFNIQGTVFNAGAAIIDSLVLNYTINGGAPTSASLNGLNILPGQTYNFSHPTTWNPGSVGSYVISIYATNLNGNADQNIVNDVFTETVQILAQVAQLTPLFEEFTSSTSAPDLPANLQFNALLSANSGNFTCVKYQMNWPNPGDIYYNADGFIRQTFYNVVAIPNLLVDGAPGIHPALFTQTDFDNEYEKPAFFNISSTYSVVGNSVSVTATILPLIDLTNPVKVFFAITESQTVNNASTSGETEFYFVEHRMMPDGDGYSIANMVAGIPVSITQNYTFPAINNVENFNNLTFPVWLQNPTTKEVYQSSFSTVLTGVQENDGPIGGIINLYPNPTGSDINVMYQLQKDETLNMSISNTLGEVVLVKNNILGNHGRNNQTLNTSILAPGTYFIDLHIANNHYRSKFVKY